MKAITQLLVSVSLFYYVFFHASPSRSYSLLHSLKFYLSAIPLHSLDKRWIFLICNGILVIIANTSGLVSFPSGKLDHNDHHKIHDHRLHAPAAVDSNRDAFFGQEVQVLMLESAEEAGNVESENYESNDHQGTNEEEDREEEEEGDNSSITIEDHEEQLEPAGEEGGDEIRIYITEDDDGDDEEDENYSDEDGFDPWEEQVEAVVVQEEEEERLLMLEKLSADELNKKFDDFIRKMKEELRIEAQQQQLVVVK